MTTVIASVRLETAPSPHANHDRDTVQAPALIWAATSPATRRCLKPHKRLPRPIQAFAPPPPLLRRVEAATRPPVSAEHSGEWLLTVSPSLFGTLPDRAAEANMSSQSPAALFKRAQTLTTRDNDGTIELAEVLSDLRALSKPPDGDRPTLNELVAHTKLSKRAVCYLLKVWRRFSDLDIPRERLAQIGWTKLAAIAENCDPGDEQNALALAETSTLKELPARLKGMPAKPKARTVLLRLTPRQHERFEAILLAHGASRPKKGWGLSGKEKALMKALGQL